MPQLASMKNVYAPPRMAARQRPPARVHSVIAHWEPRNRENRAVGSRWPAIVGRQPRSPQCLGLVAASSTLTARNTRTSWRSGKLRVALHLVVILAFAHLVLDHAH